MKLTIHNLDVALAKPFTISRGTVTSQELLIVELQHNGVSGYGEATANDYYQHSLSSITKSIRTVESRLSSLEPTSGEFLWNALHEELANDTFALSALDIAAQDLHGKLCGKPSYETWGLEWSNTPRSSLTIGIDSIDGMVATLRDNPGWDAYKVKLGTPHDVEIIEALREVTDASLRVDANCAWSADEAIEKSHELARLGVEFIEQPMLPDASDEAKAKVKAKSVLPVVADENCRVPEHVKQCFPYFHGINVKLCKCGGLTPALAMLREARSLGMSTMVGCMVESSVGISAAAQLLPLLDHADLDGAILLGNDPASGVTVDHGVVTLSNRPGCGIELRLPEAV